MTKPNDARALYVHGSLLATQILASGFHIFAKVSLTHFHPVIFSAFRMFFGACACFVLAFLTEAGRDWRRLLFPTRRVFMYHLVGGNATYWLATMCFLIGLNSSSASQAAIMQPLNAAFATAFSIALRLEGFAWLKLLGIAVAMLGVLVIKGGNIIFEGAESSMSTIGTLWFIANTSLGAVGNVLVRKCEPKMPAMTTTAWLLGLAVPGNLLCACFFSNPTPVSDMPSLALGGLAYASTLGAPLSFYLNNYAVQRIWPSVAAIYACVQPLSSSLFGAALLGDTLGKYDFIGGAVILLGVGLVIGVKFRDQRKQALTAQQQEGDDPALGLVASPRALHADSEDSEAQQPDSEPAPMRKSSRAAAAGPFGWARALFGRPGPASPSASLQDSLLDLDDHGPVSEMQRIQGPMATTALASHTHGLSARPTEIDDPDDDLAFLGA